MANVLGKTILTGLLLLALGGCASGPVAPRTTVIEPPPPYDPTLSRAMNIVIAGGLVSRPGGPILNDVPAARTSMPGGTGESEPARQPIWAMRQSMCSIRRPV